MWFFNKNFQFEGMKICSLLLFFKMKNWVEKWKIKSISWGSVKGETLFLVFMHITCCTIRERRNTKKSCLNTSSHFTIVMENLCSWAPKIKYDIYEYMYIGIHIMICTINIIFLLRFLYIFILSQNSSSNPARRI